MERRKSSQQQSGSSLDARSLRCEGFNMDFEIMDINRENVTPTPTAPCSPLRAMSDDQPPLRERFGAMTIIAATSPEIKALNLPITPTFPTEFEFGRSKSFSGFDLSPSSRTVLPGMIRTNSMRERVSFLIEQMDDVEAVSSSTDPPPPHQSSSVCYDENREDAPFRRLHEERGSQHDLTRNRENINPHFTTTNTCRSNQEIPMFETPGEKDKAIKKPPLHSRRKSFHRRDSTASLPSPAEIGASPISCESETPRQKNVSFCPSTVPPPLYGTEECDGTGHRPSSQASQPLVPKSLHLSSGFQ